MDETGIMTQNYPFPEHVSSLKQNYWAEEYEELDYNESIEKSVSGKFVTYSLLLLLKLYYLWTQCNNEKLIQ